MPFEDAADYRFNPFDLTKVWPHADYPPITIGKCTLTRNPENYFAEIEQAAFEPANFVPGIGPCPDKMLQGRLFSYPDAHRYRIGTNYLQLPVNRPKSPVHSYNKDGAMRTSTPATRCTRRTRWRPRADPDLSGRRVPRGRGRDRPQRLPAAPPRTTTSSSPAPCGRRSCRTPTATTWCTTSSCHASAPEVTGDMKKRVVEYWRNVHKDLGDRVAKGLGVNDS